MTTYKIAVLPGDGIGPEVVAQGIKVLKTVGQKFSQSFELEYADIGGAAIDSAGVPLPETTLNIAMAADTVFLGAVGDYKYDNLDPKIRPEQGLLQIRKAMNLYCNLRPVKAYDCLTHISTLKPEIIQGIDMMVVRELTGGLYFGQPKGREKDRAFDTMSYTHAEIRRIAHKGFQAAQKRHKKLCSVDKANVLVSSQAWREIVEEIAKEYPDVALSHMYVDNAAMQLILNPKQFDVMLTENTFGDILSDEASMLTGSLGMLASASLGDDNKALYEPCHGSFPSCAGQDKANPIAQILSMAMMLDYSFGMKEAAQAVETAVIQVLESGYRTFDVMADGATQVGTVEMGDRIAAALLKLPEKTTA